VAAGHLPSLSGCRAPAFTQWLQGTCLHSVAAEHLPSLRDPKLLLACQFLPLCHWHYKYQVYYDNTNQWGPLLQACTCERAKLHSSSHVTQQLLQSV
jgi:hypothetical protein